MHLDRWIILEMILHIVNGPFNRIVEDMDFIGTIFSTASNLSPVYDQWDSPIINYITEDYG